MSGRKTPSAGDMRSATLASSSSLSCRSLSGCSVMAVETGRSSAGQQAHLLSAAGVELRWDEGAQYGDTVRVADRAEPRASGERRGELWRASALRLRGRLDHGEGG